MVERGFWEDGSAMQSNRAALADVGPPAGDGTDHVLAGTGVHAEAGGSLARVVQAVDMQRQLLERDLHDGPTLTDEGLVDALVQVARAAAGPVDVANTGLSRHPAELESAIDYCCWEAIQNAAKHGGSSVRIAIFLHEDAHSVGFDVSGFDLAKAPAMGTATHARLHRSAGRVGYRSSRKPGLAPSSRV